MEILTEKMIQSVEILQMTSQELKEYVNEVMLENPVVDIHTGKMREIMLIKTSADLEYFKTMYGIETEIEKEY